MGGIGSENIWRYGTRDTCEASLRIDIRYMRIKGLLTPGRQGTLSWSRGGETTSWIKYKCHEATLELDYRTRPSGGDWTPVNEHISIEQAAQPFGGVRRYFRCPHCYRRCLVLYGGHISAAANARTWPMPAKIRLCKIGRLRRPERFANDWATTAASLIRFRPSPKACTDAPTRSSKGNAKSLKTTWLRSA